VSARVTILDAVDDANLFAPWFREPATWAAWRAFLAALFALKMTDDQFAIFKECTGRSQLPQQPATEAWLVCGRRAGKSFILALCAVFLACFYEYRKFLAPGERGTVLIIATNSKQARVIFRYVRALLTNIPMLGSSARPLMHSICRTQSRLRSILPVPRALAGMLSWQPCWMRLVSFRPTTAPIRTMTSWTRSVREWQRFRTPCCCAPRALMRAEARCGTRIAGILARTAILFLCGARQHGR